MDGGTSLGYSPWGHKESDTTKQLHSLSKFLTDCENKNIQPIGKQHQRKNPLKMRGVLGDAFKKIISWNFIG